MAENDRFMVETSSLLDAAWGTARAWCMSSDIAYEQPADRAEEWPQTLNFVNLTVKGF